jgi:hypothetical protein
LVGTSSSFVLNTGHDNVSVTEIFTLDREQNNSETLLNPLHLSIQVFPIKIADFIDSRNTKKPFVLSLFYKAPHASLGRSDPSDNALYQTQKSPIATSMCSEHNAANPAFLRTNNTILGASTGLNWATNFALRDSFCNSIIALSWALMTLQISSGNYFNCMALPRTPLSFLLLTMAFYLVSTRWQGDGCCEKALFTSQASSTTLACHRNNAADDYKSKLSPQTLLRHCWISPILSPDQPTGSKLLAINT